MGGSSPSVPNPPGNGKHCTVVLSDPRAALSLQESSESSAVFDHRQTRVPLSFLYTGRFTLQLPPPISGFTLKKKGICSIRGTPRCCSWGLGLPAWSACPTGQKKRVWVRAARHNAVILRPRDPKSPPHTPRAQPSVLRTPSPCFCGMWGSGEGMVGLGELPSLPTQAVV